MTTYDAQRLKKELFGSGDVSTDTLELIQRFLELHNLEHAHGLAEQQREIVATTQYTDAFKAVALSLTDRIDPLPELLKEHDWDETIFGGFICMKCTPEDPGWDDAVAWPCPPLRAAGLTDKRAVGIIQAHWDRIEAEHKAKQAKA